jgi:hypothetical protein
MLHRKSAFDILMNRTNRPKDEGSQPKDKTPNPVEPSTSNHSDKSNSENDVIILTDASTPSPISVKSSTSNSNCEKIEPVQKFDPSLLQHMHQYTSKYPFQKIIITINVLFKS